MTVIFLIFLLIQFISAISIIFLILFQQGKGADMGPSLGNSSIGSLFSATGAANFMSRMTKWSAVLFFFSTIALTYNGHRNAKKTLDFSNIENSLQDNSIPKSIPFLELESIENRPLQ